MGILISKLPIPVHLKKPNITPTACSGLRGNLSFFAEIFICPKIHHNSKRKKSLGSLVSVSRFRRLYWAKTNIVIYSISTREFLQSSTHLASTRNVILTFVVLYYHVFKPFPSNWLKSFLFFP